MFGAGEIGEVGERAGLERWREVGVLCEVSLFGHESVLVLLCLICCVLRGVMRKGQSVGEKRKNKIGNGLTILLLSGGDIPRYSVNLSLEGLLPRWWERRVG